MALTKTRNRTQSTLTYLAASLADVNARLRQVEASGQGAESAQASQLRLQKAALVETIRQFDPAIDPSVVAASTGRPT